MATAPCEFIVVNDAVPFFELVEHMFDGVAVPVTVQGGQ